MRLEKGGRENGISLGGYTRSVERSAPHPFFLNGKDFNNFILRKGLGKRMFEDKEEMGKLSKTSEL